MEEAEATHTNTHTHPVPRTGPCSFTVSVYQHQASGHHKVNRQSTVTLFLLVLEICAAEVYRTLVTHPDLANSGDPLFEALWCVVLGHVRATSSSCLHSASQVDNQ